ncbi:hypothetical protein IWQ62_004451 [Dispira parvispora]|uniref:glucan endo-1,3-beta-D-glucosidase n=1 Tax=Dispira parvispora TaxID=1520584 RepID=A0A9W8ASA7_9FUNG|nr:hypothetical protein IWQ62_004451 [Dispira parvispora]
MAKDSPTRIPRRGVTFVTGLSLGLVLLCSYVCYPGVSAQSFLEHPVRSSQVLYNGRDTSANHVGELLRQSRQLGRRDPPLPASTPVTDPDMNAPVVDATTENSPVVEPTFQQTAAMASPFREQSHTLAPTSLWGSIKRPYPTNAWWLNLVLGKGENPISPYPYVVTANNTGMGYSCPPVHDGAGFVHQSIASDWVLRSDSLSQRQLMSYDDLTVTYQWRTSDGQGTLDSTFAKGSPYLTVRVKNLPLSWDTQHSILEVDQSSSARTLVKLNNGQTWAFYSSQRLEFVQSAMENLRSTLSLRQPFTGVIRMVSMPTDQTQALLPALDRASSTYVTGGSTKMDFSAKDSFDLKYTYSTEGGRPEDLLMLALPHHKDLLANHQSVSVPGFRPIKGEMTGVTGSEWTLRYPINTISWFAPNPVSDQDRDELSRQVEADIRSSTEVGPKDPYFFGKGLARIARLALIADHVGRQDLIPSVVDTLKRLIDPWLKGTNSNPLVFDSTWGGLCSSVSMSDHGADFGNGVYNDHHFHYGYFVYAAATIAKYDSSWGQNNRGVLDLLVQDYASPSQNSGSFTRFRHMDFYDGHSWASGLTEFGDGRNQESTSEAVNSYYAVYLLGLALNDQELAQRGNGLLTMELVSAKRYWHMTSQTSVYPPEFSKQKVVGILWGTKADHATWFGANIEFIHGIQALPFVPVSRSLITKDWISETYGILEQAVTRTQDPMADGWREYMYMMQAVVNKDTARERLRGIQNHDDGNSRSNTLYWLSTL